MATYEETKTRLLNNLNQSSELIKTVFDTDSEIKQYQVNGISFLNSEDKKSLTDCLTAYGKYAEKLSKNSFEIAIVGLEKAGKSTFINALIENDILPSAPERCTYTTTKLVASQNTEDSAEIEFYSEDEFNEIFNALFNEAFPSYNQPVHFREISQEQINKLEQENPSIDASMISDLKDIIQYRDSLILTAERKSFSQAELITNEFKDYIRGEKIANTKNVNTAKPRSVKSIEIRSSKIANFALSESSISPVIYDVPGFDSPTRLHKNQTKERLSKADAIILVTNVGRNPSVQGTIFDRLKDVDSDNIPYKDKLFAFGNQLDTANSLDIAEQNEITFRTSLKGLAENKRIFVGSALKHLTEKKLTTESGHHTFEFQANIEEFRDELICYLQTERIEILERNIKLSLNKGRTILDDIQSSLYREVKSEEIDPENRKFDIIDSAQDDIIRNFKTKLNELNKTYLSAQKERELTERLSKEIKRNDCFSHISLDELRESNGGSSITGVSDKRAVNSRAREAKLQIILENFSNAVIAFDKSNAERLYKDIVEAFVQATSLSPTSQISLRPKIEKLFDENLKVLLDLSSGKFEYLISRYSRPLFDIFKFPLANEETSSRLAQFESTRKDFIYLSTFYSDSEVGKNNDSALTYLLLAQRESTQTDILIDRIVNVAKDLINEQTHIDKIKQATNAITGATTEVFSTLKKWRPFGKDEEVKQETPVLEPQQAEPEKVSQGITWFDFIFRPDRIGKIIEPTIIKLAKVSDSEEDVLKEINTDITNIEKIFFNAVVPAIDLEVTSYINSERQINKLLNYVESRKLNSFVRKEIVPIIAEDRIQHIDNEIKVIELKRALVERLSQ